MSLRILVLGVIVCAVHASLWLRMRKSIYRGKDGWWFKQTKIAVTVPDHWLFTVWDASTIDPDTLWYLVIRTIEGGPEPLTNTAVKAPDSKPSVEPTDSGVTDADKANAMASWQASQPNVATLQCSQGAVTPEMNDANVRIMNCHTGTP